MNNNLPIKTICENGKCTNFQLQKKKKCIKMPVTGDEICDESKLVYKKIPENNQAKTTKAITTQATTTQATTTQAKKKEKKTTCRIYYDKKWMPHNLCNEISEDQVPNEEKKALTTTQATTQAKTTKAITTQATTKQAKIPIIRQTIKMKCVPWQPMCQSDRKAIGGALYNQTNTFPILPILSIAFVGIFFISIFVKFNPFKKQKKKLSESELRKVCDEQIERRNNKDSDENQSLVSCTLCEINEIRGNNNEIRDNNTDPLNKE